MERGLIHIYCGDGKGKASGAVGRGPRVPQPSGWRSELRAAKRKCFLHVFLKMRIREN